MILSFLLICAATAEPDVDRYRSEPAVVHVSWFDLQPGDHAVIPVFPDVSFAVTVTSALRREHGATLQCRLDGEPMGTCTITIENGGVAAGFWSERGSFGLTPVAPADGSGWVLCAAEHLRPEAMTRCLSGGRALPPGIQPGPRLPTRELTEPPPYHAPKVQSEPGGAPVPRDACSCTDDQSIVDVLCVYTTLAKDAAGGAANIQTRFQNALDAANGAYTNSGINSGGVNRLQLRAAGYVEISYDENAPQWINHLERITQTGDGSMDEVHALRDQYKADTVMLIVDDDRFTGGAAWWALWDQAQAFGCMNWRSVGGGDLLLTHETGHNFGCAHDHENDSSAPLSYAWGHSFTVGPSTYGTIMSYPGNVRLQQFSNPHLVHPGTGQPIGVPAGQPRAAYNALVIRQTRWTLANYRDAERITDCNGNGLSDADDIAAGRSLDLDGDCRPDECEERRYADASIPGPGEGVSWNTAGADLAEVMSVANLSCSNIGSVWVADGTYKPDGGSGQRYTSFTMRSALELAGGFQGRSKPGGGEASKAQRFPGVFPSVLSGEIGNQNTVTDNCYSVVTARDTGASAVLDGFTVQLGYSDSWGGGLYIENASPTITNCLFRSNRAGTGGGAALANLGSPVFTGCTFDNNTAGSGGGGISAYGGGSLTLNSCSLRLNHGAWGGAAASNDSTLTLRSCTIMDNGAMQYSGGAVDMNNLRFTLENSLLVRNNSATDGGALWIANGSAARITNCTFYGNAATTFTGGAAVSFASADVANTIFWGNTGIHAGVQDKNLVYSSATGAVRYSRLQGWSGTLGGPGNSGANPLLANPGGGDVSLLAGSSCIDAGDSAALSAEIARDFLGRPRRLDDPGTADAGIGPAPVLDIGAAEYQPPACPADFNGDGFVDFFDADSFIAAFEAGEPSGDFNADGFLDFFDADAFTEAFEAGC